MKARETGIGISLPRLDAAQQVTGKSRYGADFSIPGMLHCKIKHPDRVSARILGIDVSRAEAHPGVVAVVTARDVKHNIYGITVFDQPYFVTDTVRQYSDCIAAVAAETQEAAESALSLIRVEYEDLPCLTDPVEAMKDDSFKLHRKSNVAFYKYIAYGNVEKGFAESELIVEQDFSTPGVEHCPIETHAAVAYVDEITGELVVRSSVQKPFELAADLAKMLERPISSIHVSASAIGGGFGGKNEPTMEPAVALLAIKTGRPVKCEFSREDEFNATTVRHPYRIHYKTGLMKNGVIHARQVRIVSDCGAYVSWGASTLTKASIHACGPYNIPNTRVDGYLVYTNNPVGGAMRGFGVTQLGFAYEAHTDCCAAMLRMNPLHFRKINLIHDGSVLPTAMVMNTVAVEECLDKAVELARQGGDWE